MVTIKEIITRGDMNFIREKLLPWSGVRAVNIAYSSSKKKYPDIWLFMGKGVPVITVTDEWRSHDKHLRRSQIVHEFLHILGLEHDLSIGYSTYPEYDTYSKKVYRRLIK